ncbi:hypothetical protein [Labilithrix luteola]|nr:hypothetical protein [Labilithrix luteola]
MHELRLAFQLCTVLWGGKYNLIIPAYERAPTSFNTRKSGREIVAGYIDNFQPDFVVVEKVEPERFGIRADRVRRIREMLQDEAFGDVGVSVGGFYQRAYDKTFAFVLRHKASLVNVRARGELRRFAACVFGEFPQGPHGGLERDFETLGGVRVEFTPALLDPEKDNLSPLQIGSKGLTLIAPWRRRAALLLDPQSFDDLVDCWNLRALGWRLFPVPLTFVGQLALPIAKFLAPEAAKFGAVILKGRSLAIDAFERAAAVIPVSPRNTQTEMPRAWAPEVRQADQADRPSVRAAEDDIEATVEKGAFSFKTLAPNFEPFTPNLRRASWANVIELNSHDTPSLARIFPRPIEDVGEVVSRWRGMEMVHLSSEGLTIFDSADGQTHEWVVPTGVKVFRAWAKPRFEVSVSGAGRLTNRLLEILGGPERTRTATHPDIIKLFDEITRTASRSIRGDVLHGRLKKVHGNHDVPTKNVLTQWLERGALAVGLQISCDECGQENWYALEDLRNRLRCGRCLEHYPFPGLSPFRKTNWAYRPLGPFSVEGHAHGAFTVAAAIRVLERFASDRITWVPSIDLRSADVHLEADFALFWERKFRRSHPPVVVFGECKTFGAFQDKDVKKMRALGQYFPGAVLVFASMSSTLTADEIDTLARLARWGRQKWRTPVLVLTQRELASSSGPPHCWENGSSAEKAIADSFRGRASLRMLCDASQQIHLAMQKSSDWPHYDSW